MNNNNFKAEFDYIINLIAETIEEKNPSGLIDIDINSDILTLNTNKGVFIVNKQSSVQEIWLSSPVSGPYHFIKIGKSWCSRSGTKLFNILTQELGIEITEPS